MRSTLASLATVLFASRCRLCEQLLTSLSRVPVCESCLGRVRPLELLSACDRCEEPLSLAAQSPDGEALCGRCRAGETEFDRLRAFGAYEGELRDLIVLLKYIGVRPLARPLGGWLMLVVQQHPELAAVDALVPVQTRWLKRVKDTPSQTGLSPAQRVENVRGAFATKNKLDRKRILLIDDVCTTGATLNACARVLKRAGAETVQAVTAARVVQEI